MNGESKAAVMKIDHRTRREFMRDALVGTAAIALGTFTVGSMAGCSKSSPTGPEDTSNKNGGDNTPSVTIDISQSANQALAAVGGALALGANAIDDQGLLVFRAAQGVVKAYSRTCTHRGCTIGAFQSGISTCPCHGSQFNTLGNVARGPASSSLKKYTASISGNVITITP